MPDQNDNRDGNKPDLSIPPKGNRAALVLFLSIIVLLVVFLFFGQDESFARDFLLLHFYLILNSEK